MPMCKALLARGVEVQIVSTDAEPDGHIDVTLESIINYDGVPAIFFKKQWSEALKYSRALALWLDRNVAAFDVTHIHGVFSHSCLAAANACRRHRVPYVIRPLGSLDPWSLHQKQFRKQIFLRLIGARLLSDAKAIQYVSSSEKLASEDTLSMNHGVVIPLGAASSTNGVYSDHTTSPVPVVSNQRPYVLVLSRLQPTKAIDILIEAFISVLQNDKFRAWQLVIAGDGPPQYVASLKRIINERNARDSVMFRGWLDGEAKASALSQASLLALPSYHENFGLCVVEAMACGVPVLVSPHVSLAAEIEAARAGWISAVESKPLSNTLAAALGDHNELRRRGAAGRILARKFDWDSVAEMLIRLYESILLTGKPGPHDVLVPSRAAAINRSNA